MIDIKKLVEVLLFASPDPLTQSKFNYVLNSGEKKKLSPIIKELNKDYQNEDKGLIIKEVAGGYQMLSDSKYHIYIERLFSKTNKVHLSKPAIEALAIIAYRQPITRLEIESIRGVECGSVVKTLLERNLVTVKGRDSKVGRPLLFGTTQHFMQCFGLNKISDLPRMKEFFELSEEALPKKSIQQNAFE